jgi:homeobox-leucine zipper protein
MEEGEEVGLALGLSLGSGHHWLKEQPSRSSPPCALEPSLSLSIKADDGSLTTQAVRPLLGAVKRELPVQDDDGAMDRALYSAAAGDDDEGCNSRKKLRLSKQQSALLEDRFKEHSTLNPVSALASSRISICSSIIHHKV